MIQEEIPTDNERINVVESELSEVILLLESTTTGKKENDTPTDHQKMSWDASTITLSIALFIIAGILEVGGGYMIWLGIREKKLPYVLIPLGAVVLIAYGVVPTFQPVSSFGRVFAVYGGFFIILSYLWAYVFDGFKPDAGDYIGAAIALVGVCVTWFWPR